jgi:hypothetical protein
MNPLESHQGLSFPARTFMRLIFPRLGLLSLVCLLACSNDDPRRGEGVDAQALPPVNEAGEPDGLVRDASSVAIDGGLDGGMDAGKRDGGFSGGGEAGTCLALGCEELGYECGRTVDNCGDPLNCNLEDNKSPCSAPERCGGDPDLGPQKCGCKARVDACAASGAQCGLIDECGKQVNCGNCANGAVCLGNSCNCGAVANPCGTRVCGDAPDGCGGTVKCGPSAGLCSVGVCDATAGTCACPPSAEVCVGKTGPGTVSGCDYTCGGGVCVPDNAAACAGAECGTARNNCGDTVSCGLLAGACVPGNTCIGTQYVTDSTLPARTGSYAGGYCVADGVAQLLGKYAVRVHSFREAGTTSINFLNRAEAVELVTIDYSRASGQARLTDIGCTATTVGDPAELSGGGTKSSIPKYRNLPPAVVPMSVTGSQFTRLEGTFPGLPIGSPGGFLPGMPSYCVGFEGQTVDLPANDTRRGKWWADNRCTCPTAATTALLPAKPASADPNNYSTTSLRDCRIIDDDLDNKPGFTGKASALGLINSELYNANISHGIWLGAIRADRFHIGYYSEPNPVSRVVLGCLATGGACAPPGVDCGCAERWQTVQFVPLADSAAMSCGMFLTNFNAANEGVNQTAIDAMFSVPFGTCSAAGQCPEGSLCRANRCFPETSKGACTSGSQNPCPAGTFCEGCPNDPASAEAEMTCRSDTSCWPTTAECPIAGSPNGGFCTPTPP